VRSGDLRDPGIDRGCSNEQLIYAGFGPKFPLPMQLRRLYPFCIVFAIELSFTLYLIVAHRGVIGHDAFQYFALQYYFLNNAVNSGETAQWLPLLTHGTVANWWYGLQAGIVQSAMLALGSMNSIFRGWNFLPIYYLGLLFDSGLFLLGIVLLGKRYFTSNLTALFVAVTALGSVIPFSQPWFNLHFYFALPLILYLVHAMFETGKWRYFLLAGNLFVVQWSGDSPYLGPFSAFVICVYAAFYVLFFWDRARKEVGRLLLNWKSAVLPIAIVIASLYFVNGMLSTGTAEIVNYNPGRMLDGRNVSLDAFLHYGTNTNFRWSELISRVSPAWDYNLYIGYLSLAFVPLAMTRKRNPALLMVACTTLVVLLVSASTFLATALYYVWPGMQFFRHLSLASPIVRVLLCLISGFGFEQILVSHSKEREQRDRVKIRLAIIVLVGVAGYLMALSRWYEYAKAFLALSVSGSLPLDPRVFEVAYLPGHLFQASLWCLGAAAFFALMLSGRVSRKALIVAAICLQTLDLYSFKIELARFRTIPLTPDQYSISSLQPMPYSYRRMPIDYAAHARARNVPQTTYSSGPVYSTQDLVTFTDGPSNAGRTDHWLLVLDDFLRTFSGDRIRDLEHKPTAFMDYQTLKFPDDSNARKLAGVTADKIQFFSRAHSLASDQTISEMLASEIFSGDILLLSDSNAQTSIQAESNERVQREYRVIQYDSDNVAIRVEGAAQGDWLYYADCWHPFWSATVNGKASRVYKANLAYKAVALEGGENIVRFRFHSSGLAFFMGVLNWNALIWFVLPFWLFWRAVVLPDEVLDSPR
jgi:hypothetical protein